MGQQQRCLYQSFWTNYGNLPKTIRGQRAQPIKILEHGFIGNVTTY
jgi:hypothetical protein